ncbi:hypothetical protein KR054_011544, partial [Drosophila jambulina]
TSITIRNDYCEMYCGTCENRTCLVANEVLITDDYKIMEVFLVLKFIWTNPVYREWNIHKLSNDSNLDFVRVSVSGIPSANDVRFLPSKFYLQKLGVKDITGFDIESPSLKVEERDITNGPEKLTLRYLSDNSVNSDVTNDYIRKSTDNLKHIAIVSSIPTRQLTVQIEKSTFVGKSQLTSLAFAGLKVENLQAKIFDNLMNLEFLVLSHVTLKDLSLLESKVLRQTLKDIIIKTDSEVDMRDFGPFPKLETIEVDKYKPFKNLTAFICRTGYEVCVFQLGRNGIPCPSRCKCLYNRNYREFEINCSQRFLFLVPTLPVPITGNTILLLQGNYLTKLPDYSLPGYNFVKKLNVSQNQLTSLSVSQLPTNLENLDISYNEISTLSPEVLEYVANLTEFKQFGNKWIFYCDEQHLIEFSRRKMKSVRILKDKLDPILEIMDRTTAGAAAFLIEFFKLHPENLYYEADEDEILNSQGSEGIFVNHLILEDLHRITWMFSAEYDDMIMYHLNASCPYRCDCCVDRESGQFIINCSKMHLEFYPILPLSIPYNTTLLLDGNIITKLDEPPFLGLPGHASIQQLHVQNNRLKEFPHHLLPENLTYLDLRNNFLRTLDDVVVDFMRYREGLTEIKLSGNPWECDCSAKSFLSFLREREPEEYAAALSNSNVLSTGGCPDACICCLDQNTNDLAFIIDCSSKGLMEIPPLPTLTFGFASVTRLHVAHNRLANIGELPKDLVYLDIRNNRISGLSDRNRTFFDKRMNSSQLELQLSGNPWTCGCKEIDFLKFVKRQAKYIADTSFVVCADSGQLLIETEESDICPSAFIYYATLAASMLVVASSINVFICFRQPILIWFYEHEVCLSLAARRDMDQDKRYDAFLAFCHKDEELIEEFVEQLERGKHEFRLCFYLRDWLVGASIPECISQSVKDSRRIIILMTDNFLKSTWGRLEFRLALHATSKDRCKRLIVILYPDVKDFDDLDSELKAYMVLNTYLKRDSPNFWNKLIYSMP